MKQYKECPNTTMILSGMPIDPESKTVILYRPACKSWHCPYCQKRLKVAWGQKVFWGVTIGQKAFGWNASFVTLTSHEKLKTFHATAAVWPHVWSKFSARLRRAYNSPEYVSVPEKHRDGRLHFHLIMSVSPKKKWLKDNLRASGGGYQVDRQEIEDGTKAAWYCTKYLHKQMRHDDDFATLKMRRINTSRGWPEEPVGDAFDVPEVTWSIAQWQGEKDRVIEHYRHLGYRVRLMGGWGEYAIDDIKIPE